VNDDIVDACRYAYSQMLQWLPEERTVLDLYPLFTDYKRIRRGRKYYGFVPKARPNDVVANYYCSWVEADRRFKMLLLTRRMMK